METTEQKTDSLGQGRGEAPSEPYRGAPDADHPAVSIIVPVWKDARWVRRCLRSVIAQRTGLCCECIVVDDCGGDGSMAIVEEMIRANDDALLTFRIIRHERNEGVSVARNDGIRAARGLYITFLDADDEWQPAFLKTLLRLALRHHLPDMVRSEIDERGKTRMLHHPWPAFTAEASFMEVLVKGFVMPGARLLRRRLFSTGELFFISGIRHEDEPWHFHEARLVRTVAATPLPLYIYHDNPTSYTRTEQAEVTYGYYRVIFRHLLACVNRQDPEELMGVTYKYVMTALSLHRRLPDVEQMIAGAGLTFSELEQQTLDKIG